MDLIYSEDEQLQQLATRFWSSVDMRGLDDCWAWLGMLNQDGYGRMRARSTLIGSHRLAWLLTNGAIEGDLHILHSCDNRRCCNPRHLRTGTHLENIADMNRKDRHAKIGTNLRGARLSREQVASIQLEPRPMPKARRLALAAQYGVHQTTIWNVSTGRTWQLTALGVIPE
jgi:hypothetical protein